MEKDEVPSDPIITKGLVFSATGATADEAKEESK